MRLSTLLMLLAIAMMTVGCEDTATKTETHPQGKPLFDRLDADGDGAVSKAEHAAAQPKRFDRYDADDDGAVTEVEFVEAMMPIHDRNDLNDDGGMTVEEMLEAHGLAGVLHKNSPGEEDDPGRQGRLFRLKIWAADTNGDSKLTREEFAQVVVAWHEAGDADKDGKVSQEEFRARMVAVFKRIDEDKDGRITVEELQKDASRTT